MKEVTLHCTTSVNADIIEHLCGAINLSCTMRGSLKSIPDNIHWHYKSGKSKGVLEITLILDPPDNVILNYKDNRKGDWIDAAISHLSAKLMRQSDVKG